MGKFSEIDIESREESLPDKEEVLAYMILHNGDEAGIDNQWDIEDAEYYLLLDDKYYYLNV